LDSFQCCVGLEDWDHIFFVILIEKFSLLMWWTNGRCELRSCLEARLFFHL
jgi:hypothetical protein